MSTSTTTPLACVADAISPAERSAHFALLARLFAAEARERRVLPDGYAFRFERNAWADIARWIDNERRCCPFLRFDLELLPGDAVIWVRLSGPPGVHAFLDAELPRIASAAIR